MHIHSLKVNNKNEETNYGVCSKLIIKKLERFEQLNPNWVTLSIHEHKNIFLLIQLRKNFSFTKLKLKLHGFH